MAVIGNIERIDQNYMDKLIPSNAIVEIRAEKISFPLWWFMDDKERV